ncbi:MAG: hypothetical protein PHR81_07320, partial [Bacteroidales bacterium]|nr:hypothetical protein [Bacteroidales bacterium]
MKKLVLAVSVILISAAVFSQNAKVVSAYNYLRNGQLDKAKQNIDEACVHEQTMGQAKTWFYCGNIYLSLTGTDNEKYKALSENPMQVAYDAYQKALKIDPEIQNESLMPYSPKVGLLILGEQYINKGADFYQQQNFTEAISMFEMSRKISGIFSQKDTIATYYAAICAIQMQDNAKAKSYLEDLTKANIKQGLVYTQLATIYKNEGDSVKAMNTILKGRKLMPNDL